MRFIKLTFAGLGVLGTMGASAVTLTPDSAEVVVAAGAASSVRFAGEEMTNFLSRVLGAAVPVVTDANGLADPGRLVSPKIAAIRVEGAHVVITVDNLRPGLRYSVRGGLDRSVQLTAPAFGPGETVDFVVPKSDASFFSISAE